MWSFTLSSPVTARFSPGPRVSHFFHHQRCLSNTKKIARPSPSRARQRNKRSSLLRPAVFTAAVCFGSFGAVSIWNYEQQLRRKNNSLLSSATLFVAPQRQSWWRIPPALREYLPIGIVSSIEKYANDTRVATVGPIIAANVVIFCAFGLARRSSRAGKFLDRFFVHDTGSGRALPLLLSCFAHTTPLHLGVNMYVLWSFADPLVELFGEREQFWAAYVSAGTFSSCGAVCLDLAMKSLRKLPMSKGLGASGALYGVIVAFGLANPDARMGIIFLPGLEFSAAEAIKALVMFDFIGLMLGWHVLGHAAHLGGAAAGFFAIEMGGLRQMVPAYQDFVKNGYKELREGYVGAK